MIGKAIEYKLKNTAAITNIIGNRVYPVMSKAQTAPFVYYSVKIYPEYVKQGAGLQKWKVAIITFERNYNAAWTLTMLVKQTIDKLKQKTVEGIKIGDAICTAITDDHEFNLNSFGQIIEFDITTQNIKI